MYGYHKPKGKLFYVGVGAAMFARTKVEITPKVTQTLITNIRQAIKNHSKNHQ
ncbi:MAG: hypothetical protein LBG59_07890 [Candidatus Peribacteria bacterium]|jgi:hypothetical protein|nr:hypothetical protein [Candidatus Peribacteria bacterium]